MVPRKGIIQWIQIKKVNSSVVLQIIKRFYNKISKNVKLDLFKIINKVYPCVLLPLIITFGYKNEYRPHLTQNKLTFIIITC